MPTLPSSSATSLFSFQRANDAAPESVSLLNREVLGFFDELRAPLLRYALSFGLSIHDAEDTIQEVFLALFQHLRQNGSRSNLHGWLFRVTHNLALRRRQRSQAHEVDAPAEDLWLDPSPNPEELLLSSERQAQLRAVLRVLPEMDQHCLRLRAEGLRYREISAVLGISLGSVSTSLARTFARLARTEGRR
ncbi:sigma-70 family RNA polymerase sigma factor [Granulicella sp. WH15]|uniref:RNA polymerase sigma factor n=1 Tax=Granulicella sp. WH15 TaxID=2602070 RepID=UPI0013A5AA93|nr:sigma-70 family RNA polymerase sigma factor [Granulicella sp. WH15]